MDSRGEDKCAQGIDAERSAHIRQLNDQFRRHRKGGYFCLSTSVAALGDRPLEELLRAVATFDDFMADNDPYGEHDFGALHFAGVLYFWKIDYYDTSQTWTSPDPADASVTLRFLTVMLASEY